MAKPIPEKVPFDGFHRDFKPFFAKLARNNTREYFSEHKKQYESLCKAPFESYLDAAHASLQGAYGAQDLKPPKLFRIYRDTRFAKDKTPLKTNIAGAIMARPGEGMTSGLLALYVQFGQEDLGAAGLYAAAPEQLKKLRAALLDERSGNEIVQLVKSLERKGFVLVSAGQTKQTPRGVDKDHPRADLLKHKGLALEFPPLPSGTLYSVDSLKLTVQYAKLAAPVVQWLDAHVCKPEDVEAPKRLDGMF